MVITLDNGGNMSQMARKTFDTLLDYIYQKPLKVLFKYNLAAFLLVMSSEFALTLIAAF